MAARPSFAFAQANGPLPAMPWGRILPAAAGLLAAAGLAYLGARETSMFALERVEISGAPPGVRAAVREAVDPHVGETLVSLDGAALQRRLEALPSVRSIVYDRAFPHTLRLVVRPETPVAVLRRGDRGWLVSERGRVIARVPPGTPRRYPSVRLGSGDGVAIAPGHIVGDQRARTAIRALTRVPERFPGGVRSARFGEDGLVFVLHGKIELRLGAPSSLETKLAVAARVLTTLAADETGDLAYLDVSVPDRPVGGQKSQLST